MIEDEDDDEYALKKLQEWAASLTENIPHPKWCKETMTILRKIGWKSPRQLALPDDAVVVSRKDLISWARMLQYPWPKVSRNVVVGEMLQIAEKKK